MKPNKRKVKEIFQKRIESLKKYKKNCCKPICCLPKGNSNGPGEEMRPFIFVVNTENDGGSDNNQFLLSVEGDYWDTIEDGAFTLSLGNEEYTINTSDGQELNNVTGNQLLTFPSPGVYTIEVWADKFAVSLSDDSEKIVEIIQWGTPKFQFLIADDSWWNNNNIDMRSTLDIPNLTECTHLNLFLYNYKHSTVNNIGNWNVSNVTSMDYMFADVQAFNQDLGGWNVSNVTSMNYMFAEAQAFNQDIGNWNVSNVMYMIGMFLNTQAFNQDIGNWNVSNVTDMEGVFQNTQAFNQDIGNWNVSNVMNMTGMFVGTQEFNQDLGGWNVSNVTRMWRMFEFAQVFNQDLSSWCVSSVTNYTQFDSGASAWVLPKPNFANPPC